MSVVWLINPHELGTPGQKAETKRKETMARTATKKSTGARKKPRSAAQKAATAKMLAANKRARAAKAGTAAKPAAKRPSYKKPAAAAKAPAKRKYKKNPVSKQGFMDQALHDFAIPAGIGIGGALATDAVWGNLKFIPVEKRVGKLKYLGKSLIGVGASVGLGMMLPQYRKYTNQIGVGTLIVNGHAASSEFIQAKFPNLGLGGYDDFELNEAIEQLNGLGEAMVSDALPAPVNNGLGAFHDIGYYAHA